jgi:hypothetical protein
MARAFRGVGGRSTPASHGVPAALAALVACWPLLARAAGPPPSSGPFTPPAPAPAASWRADADEADAGEPETAVPRLALRLQEELLGTLNPSGLLLDLDLALRGRLYRSTRAPFAHSLWGLGLRASSSPVFVHAGPYVELQPAAFLTLTVAYQLFAYFGVLGALHPLADCDPPLLAVDRDTRCVFAEDALGAPIPNATADWGHRASAALTLRGALGRLYAEDTLGVERWWFRADWAAGPAFDYWYNELHLLPQARDDVVVLNDAALMLEVLAGAGDARPSVLVGLDDSLGYADATRYVSHRVGPAVALWVPALGPLREVSVVLLVQWYTHDRYKVGPLPFAGLALAAASAGPVLAK